MCASLDYPMSADRFRMTFRDSACLLQRPVLWSETQDGTKGIRMMAGGGEEVISVQATGRFLGKLMTFLLKKPAYYVEIPFPHYVKVQFQIEIPFPDTLKIQFQIEILFPHYVKVQFQIEILFPHYVNVQFQIEIPFPHYVKVQSQNEIPFSHYVKVQFQNEIPLLYGLNVIFQKIFIFSWHGKAFERSPGRFSAAKKCTTWVAI